MDRVASQDINKTDKTTITKRLDPQQIDWVVPTKEESIKIDTCLIKHNNWDGIILRPYQIKSTEDKILKDHYLDPKYGAVHYQHHIFFRKVTLYYPRANYKWYAEASHEERRERARQEFENTDTPWELLWNSDDESVTTVDTHGDLLEDYVQVRNLKFPDVRAVEQVLPTARSKVVRDWVYCTKSDYRRYITTKYRLCETTGITYRTILKIPRRLRRVKKVRSAVASLPKKALPKKGKSVKKTSGLNTENIYRVLDRVVGIQQNPGFAVNRSGEIRETESDEESQDKNKLSKPTKTIRE